MGKIDLRVDDSNVVRRKIAMGTWNQPKDCQVYGYLEIDITDLLPKMKKFSEQIGRKINLNHVVGKAITICFQNRPELNGLIRGNRVYLRKHVKLCYLVNMPSPDGDVKKNNLSACGIDYAEDLKISEFARVMEEKAEAVRKGRNKEIKQNMDAFKFIPWCLVKAYMNFASFLIYGLNFDLEKFGIPKDPFGSVIITNIGSLGIDVAWAPLVPYARTPMVVTICGASDKPWIHEGEIKIRKILPIACTFDHRFADGAQMARMTEDFKKCLNEPEKYLFDG